ncbi:hypothetical protein [Salinimicrobium oceani]|uniref:Uncharacterized protein n=1 Tax=Salinimicrobium oceani TaxID=2722702 RepID=A0ABX1CVF9_9FLAO|nr:hypothetical protein [Salinimicrobium oceani]NJW52264.1 hypothetical protein [Salinimicrobium oceani]
MKRILQISGGIFLVYSVAGMVLHALANLEEFGHHCEMLLFSFEEDHLVVFTLTAAISATLFLTVKTMTGRAAKERV